jgi:hypothetical protein
MADKNKSTNWFSSVSVWFDYFILKTKNYIVLWGFFFVMSNGFGFGLSRFFFGSVINLCSVFWFQAYETETEPVGFFKYSNRVFFYSLVFSIIFFLVFSV